MARTRIGWAPPRRIPTGRGSGGKEPKQQQQQLGRPISAPGRGEKDIDQLLIRNTCYKMKRYITQPKDVKVKHNGRVVRRMVVRRRAIYVTGRRRLHY